MKVCGGKLISTWCEECKLPIINLDEDGWATTIIPKMKHGQFQLFFLTVLQCYLCSKFQLYPPSIIPFQTLVVSNLISQRMVCERPTDSQTSGGESVGRIKALFRDILTSLDAHDWDTAKSKTQELSERLQPTQGYVQPSWDAV